jgi:very-short-patch-repair endonuclease
MTVMGGQDIGEFVPLPNGERVAAKRPGEGAFAPKPSARSKPFARQMRTQPTDAESLLWFELRNRLLNGYRFNRQVRIGPYIADFACRSRRLIVELDGAQHSENAADLVRTKALNAAGFSVLRFWSDEVVFERGAVLDTILAVLEGQIYAPSPGLRFAPADLSPEGRGNNRRRSE